MEVVSNIVWTIGNISADAPKFRDRVVAADGISGFLKIIQENKCRDLIELAVWALCNLCRGDHVKKFKNLKEISVALCQVLKQGVLKLKEEEVISDIMWTLSYICDGTQKRIEMIYEQDILRHLMAQLYDTGIIRIITPALRIIGNFTTGNEKHTEAVI